MDRSTGGEGSSTHSQSSVTHHLARLEAETGAEVLQRVGRGIRLTPAGELLADRAAEMIGRIDAAGAELSGLALHVHRIEGIVATGLPGWERHIFAASGHWRCPARGSVMCAGEGASTGIPPSEGDDPVVYEPFVLDSDLAVHRHETPSGAYQFPLRATDLPANLYWTVGNKDQDSTNHHYGTQQAYAYDIVAQRWTGPPDLSVRCPSPSPFDALESEDWDCEWTTLTEDGVDKEKSNQDLEASDQESLVNEDYLAYGMPVHAMDSGTILECRDSNPDQTPGVVLGAEETNRLWIQHGDGEYALYAHLKQDSIPDKLCPDEPTESDEPATVHAGQRIGSVGNTGATAEPHLHVDVRRRPAVDGGAPGLPLMFDRFKTAPYEIPREGDVFPPGNFSFVSAGMPRAIPQARIVVPLPMVFAGFAAPVNNDVVNAARAGQTIPIKYRLTEYDGTAVSDSASFTSLKSQKGGDLCTGFALDAIEAYAAGGSGLQYLGDGNWQFNWKTPKDFAGQCRKMTLTLGDGSTHTATFQFM